MQNKVSKKPSCVYRLFKSYLRFIHDKVYYKRTYALNKQSIPSNGTPVLIVSNHQNCLNDPLGILFSFSDRKANFITRADVFALSPLVNKFFLSIGLLPAFRMQYDGEESLGNNDATFKKSEAALLQGSTVVMFPEAGHQDKHWLGSFSLGYTKLAFEAAEMGNFNTEIFILPSCNHYSNYFGIQNQFMVKFGTPISLKPYYELYQTKPRTAQREVNKLVRAQIEDLMLNITDLENYDEIYYLCSNWGMEYAESRGIDTESLPDMLLIHKEVAQKIANAKQEDEASVNQLFSDVKTLKEEIKRTGISYKQLERAPQTALTIGKTLLLGLLFPLFVVSLWPSLPIYGIAMLIFKKNSKDRMFEGTFLYAISALITIPLLTILTFVLDWIYINIWMALTHILLFPALMLLAWKYKEWGKSILRDFKYLRAGKAVKETLIALKGKIGQQMNKIITSIK